MILSFLYQFYIYRVQVENDACGQCVGVLLGWVQKHCVGFFGRLRARAAPHGSATGGRVGSNPSLSLAGCWSFVRACVCVDRRSGGDEDDRVRRDIRDLEGVEEDNASMASSRKEEEVANAYRDYLRSIRDGGFESYLDDESGDGGNDVDGGMDDDDDAVDLDNREIDIEEERRVGGSMYGALYGVQDVRASPGAVVSPYKAWRARARELALREAEREGRIGKGGGAGGNNGGDDRGTRGAD